MKHLTYVLLALLGLWPVGVFACDPVPASYMAMKNPVTLSEARVDYFRKQFKTKCARCHGEKGDGAGDEARDLKVQPAKLSDPEFMRRCADGQLFYQIEKGGEEKSAMPAFGPDSAQGWNEEKIWGMVAFIRRFAAGQE